MKSKLFISAMIIVALTILTVTIAVVYKKTVNHGVASAIREFGTEEEFVDDTGNGIRVNLLFPSFSVASVDKPIFTWAQNVYKRAQQGEYNSHYSVGGLEIQSQYDSYFFENRYVSVYERLSPTDEYKVFNIDLASCTFLGPSDILDESRFTDIVALIQKKILQKNKRLLKSPPNPSFEWLENLVITHKGVNFVLPYGEFLLTYKELGDCFILFSRPSATPIPQPTMTPTYGAAIALTFDDGPSKYTEQILDILEANGAKATFFVLGNRVKQYEDTIARAAKQGHQIAGHSWQHQQFDNMTALEIERDLQRTADAIFRATGERPKFYRPPYGSVSDNTKLASQRMGFSMVNWSVDPVDWQVKNSKSVYRTIINDTKPGSIILCHDIYPSTVSAMEKAIPELIDKGFRLVTVGELLGEMQAGATYMQAEGTH